MTFWRSPRNCLREGIGISNPFRVFWDGSPSRTRDLDLRFLVAIIAPILA